MSLIQKKWIAPNAVGASQIQLENNQPLRARNAANTADVNLFKLDAANLMQFLGTPQMASTPALPSDIVNVAYVTSAINAAITGALIYQGVFDASAGNYSAIVNPSKGAFYRVSVAGVIGGENYKIGDDLIINKNVIGSPTSADVDHINNVESPDILRTGMLTSGQIFVGSSGNLATAVTMSGDVTLNNLGVASIGSTRITNGMLAGSIADSKLSTITTAGKVAGSAIQLGSNSGLADSTGLVVSNLANSNVSATAAIVESKLSLDYSTSSLHSSITGHISNTTGAHAASAISYDHTTSLLSAINVQTAIDEVEGRLDTAESTLASHVANTSNPHGTTKAQVGLGNVDNVQQIPMSYLDTDGTLAANSDSKVASQKAVKTYVASQLATMHVPAMARFTLSSTNITNQYIDLSDVAFSAASVQVVPNGAPMQDPVSDFSISLTGGVSGKTRISFLGDLAVNAAAGDILVVYYSK